MSDADRTPSPAPAAASGTVLSGAGAPDVHVDATDRPDPRLPGSAWLLAGLATVHGTLAAAVLAGPPGVDAAVASAVDAGLAVLLAFAASATVRTGIGERAATAALVAAALATGLRAGAIGGTVLTVGAVACVAGVLVLRSLRAVLVVLAAVLVSVVAGAGVAVARGGTITGAVVALGTVAGVAVVVVGLRRNAAQQARIADAARRATDAVRMTDGLTGLLNRRGLELTALPMIENARRRGEAVYALFVDVDGFGDVNRSVGFDRGDDLLAAVAEALRGGARATDVVCRAGGDEFVVLGPGTGTSPLELERRMREILRAAPPVDEAIWPHALSIGSATLVPWDDGDLASLLSRAEQDMRLRRSLRRQSQDRRDGAAAPRDAAPQS